MDRYNPAVHKILFKAQNVEPRELVVFKLLNRKISCARNISDFTPPVSNSTLHIRKKLFLHSPVLTAANETQVTRTTANKVRNGTRDGGAEGGNNSAAGDVYDGDARIHIRSEVENDRNGAQFDAMEFQMRSKDSSCASRCNTTTLLRHFGQFWFKHSQGFA